MLKIVPARDIEINKDYFNSGVIFANLKSGKSRILSMQLLISY
jgi:lipopolysaccharide biosynthesis glycosyltransferase